MGGRLIGLSGLIKESEKEIDREGKGKHGASATIKKTAIKKADTKAYKKTGLKLSRPGDNLNIGNPGGLKPFKPGQPGGIGGISPAPGKPKPKKKKP